MDFVKERKGPRIKILKKKSSSGRKERVAFPGFDKKAHVPEFTLAGQTCLSILNRKPIGKKKSRTAEQARGCGGRINRRCATAIRLIEIQVFPTPFDLAA